MNRRSFDPLTGVLVALLVALPSVAVGQQTTRPAGPGPQIRRADMTGRLGTTGSVTLFNGRDLAGWRLRTPERSDTWRVVADVALDPDDKKKLVAPEGAPAATTGAKTASAAGILFRQPVAHGSDILTERTFGDCELHLELMAPQGSNSGVYLMGQYEVQVFDSFGKPAAELKSSDMGGIYSAATPRANASKAPGEWQTLDIVFRAPRFDATGKKIANARFLSVVLNGETIHEDVEVKSPTGGELPGGEQATGPLMLQGDHDVVAYRNIRVKLPSETGQ